MGIADEEVSSNDWYSSQHQGTLSSVVVCNPPSNQPTEYSPDRRQCLYSTKNINMYRVHNTF